MTIPSYVNETHKQFWPQFTNWCTHNGINNHPSDMEPWWDCFIAGATAMYLAINRKEV